MPDPTLSPDDQAELARRREEFWRRVGATAIGVFVGLSAHSLLLYLILSEWVERNL